MLRLLDNVRFFATLLGLCVGLSSASSARADQPRPQRVEIVGAERTRPSTLLELLPRQPPAQYTDAELRELERRIANLEIFDEVSVLRTPLGDVRISVREKWTLVPNFDLATGTSLEDIYVLLGVIEYNLFGSASKLELDLYHERRGFGFYASLQEHVYRRGRWALAAEAAYEATELHFAQEGWSNTTALVYLWSTSPPILSDHLRYELGAFYRRELIGEVEGAIRPPDGHAVGGSMMFTWDTYEWHDLAPRGLSVGLSAAPGFFFGDVLPQGRHRGDLITKAALRLTRTTALMLRLEGGILSRGNPNHSLPLGSVKGVRGLEDGRYFNWAQVFANLELRQAIPLAERWALQGVLFVDAAAFEGITALGGRGAAEVALSGGIGVRILPTWLSGLILRFDVARLFSPETSLFYQYGLSQYF